MDAILNRDLLPHNVCFGCGGENPAGLRIEVYEDPSRKGVLLGKLRPTEDMIGFPGITHGGIIYTALDCLSTWVATLFGPNREAGWVLRSASTTYHNPAPVGEPLLLEGSITQQAGAWKPVLVGTEARRQDGKVCVEAEFKVVPLPHKKLAQLAGLAELPENWRAFLSDES